MLDKIKQFLKKNYKLIIATFLIGLLVHGFALTNKLITYDEMNHIFAKGVSYESARWGLELISLIFPNVSMPWYNGILAIAILSISFALLVDILQIKNKYFKIIICGVLMTFPAISNTFGFMYAVTAYSISIFFSILSVALLRSNKKLVNFLAIITIILSLSIYQSYICITMIMLIILLMKDCTNEKTNSNSIIHDIIKYLILIVISLVLYYVISRIINHVLNISFTDYKGINQMGKLTLKDIINGIVSAYDTVFQLFNESSISNTFALQPYMRNLFLIIALFGIFLTIAKFINLIKNKEKAKAILLLVLLIIQPIAINFIIVINPRIDDIYSIMIYQYVFVIIEPIILYEWFNNNNNKVKNILYGIFIFIIFQFVTIANESYFRLYLSYENIYSFSSGLVNRIMATEGYDKSTPVIFIGEYKGELNTQYYDYFGKITYMGSDSENSDRIIPDMRYKFIKYFIGIDINFKYPVDVKEEINNIKKKSEYKQMNVYPYNNSIRKIDDIIVVKFSD